jgi:hypothetical protein
MLRLDDHVGDDSFHRIDDDSHQPTTVTVSAPRHLTNGQLLAPRHAPP